MTRAIDSEDELDIEQDVATAMAGLEGLIAQDGASLLKHLASLRNEATWAEREERSRRYQFRCEKAKRESHIDEICLARIFEARARGESYRAIRRELNIMKATQVKLLRKFSQRLRQQLWRDIEGPAIVAGFNIRRRECLADEPYSLKHLPPCVAAFFLAAGVRGFGELFMACGGNARRLSSFPGMSEQLRIPAIRSVESRANELSRTLGEGWLRQILELEAKS